MIGIIDRRFQIGAAMVCTEGEDPVRKGLARAATPMRARDDDIEHKGVLAFHEMHLDEAGHDIAFIEAEPPMVRLVGGACNHLLSQQCHVAARTKPAGVDIDDCRVDAAVATSIFHAPPRPFEHRCDGHASVIKQRMIKDRETVACQKCRCHLDIRIFVAIDQNAATLGQMR